MKGIERGAARISLQKQYARVTHFSAPLALIFNSFRVFSHAAVYSFEWNNRSYPKDHCAS